MGLIMFRVRAREPLRICCLRVGFAVVETLRRDSGKNGHITTKRARYKCENPRSPTILSLPCSSCTARHKGLRRLPRLQKQERQYLTRPHPVFSDSYHLLRISAVIPATECPLRPNLPASLPKNATSTQYNTHVRLSSGHPGDRDAPEAVTEKSRPLHPVPLQDPLHALHQLVLGGGRVSPQEGEAHCDGGRLHDDGGLTSGEARKREKQGKTKVAAGEREREGGGGSKD